MQNDEKTLEIEEIIDEFPERMVITKDEYEIMNNIFVIYTSGIMNNDDKENEEDYA